MPPPVTKSRSGLRNLSTIRADLIRISTSPVRGNSNYCGYQASTSGHANYNCNQPNGYVTFQWTGITSDPIGSDSASNVGTGFSGRWNAAGMGTAPVSSLSYTATCVARNVTPLILQLDIHGSRICPSILSIAIRRTGAAVVTTVIILAQRGDFLPCDPP